MTSAAARPKAALFQAFKTTTPNKIRERTARGQATGATASPRGRQIADQVREIESWVKVAATGARPVGRDGRLGLARLIDRIEAPRSRRKLKKNTANASPHSAPSRHVASPSVGPPLSPATTTDSPYDAGASMTDAWPATGTELGCTRASGSAWDAVHAPITISNARIALVMIFVIAWLSSHPAPMRSGRSEPIEVSIDLTRAASATRKCANGPFVNCSRRRQSGAPQ